MLSLYCLKFELLISSDLLFKPWQVLLLCVCYTVMSAPLHTQKQSPIPLPPPSQLNVHPALKHAEEIYHNPYPSASYNDLIQCILPDSQIRAYVDAILVHYEMALRFPNIPDLPKQVGIALSNYESYAYAITELWFSMYNTAPQVLKNHYEAANRFIEDVIFPFLEQYKYLCHIADMQLGPKDHPARHPLRSDLYESHLMACLRVLTKYLLRLRVQLRKLLGNSLIQPATLSDIAQNRPHVDSLPYLKTPSSPEVFWEYPHRTKPTLAMHW
jgi:hypothetical protein